MSSLCFFRSHSIGDPSPLCPGCLQYIEIGKQEKLPLLFCLFWFVGFLFFFSCCRPVIFIISLLYSRLSCIRLLCVVSVCFCCGIFLLFVTGCDEEQCALVSVSCICFVFLCRCCQPVVSAVAPMVEGFGDQSSSPVLHSPNRGFDYFSCTSTSTLSHYNCFPHCLRPRPQVSIILHFLFYQCLHTVSSSSYHSWSCVLIHLQFAF